MRSATLIFSALAVSSFANAKLNVGVVGAGASGLYAAILLQSMGIDVEILEASERSGGRIWTHYFDPEAWKASKPGEPSYYDYFDVGAMRIPQTPFMDRLVGNQSYSLVSYINRNVKGPDKLKLIPYIFSNNHGIRYFNHIACRASDSLTGDPFKTGSSIFAKSDPQSIWNSIMHDFTTTLSINFAEGFAQLSRYGQSVRQYLSARGFSFFDINWLETFLDGTGHFDADLTETVLEDWLFGTDKDYTWTTIEGGMSRLINSMESLLKAPIQYSQRVTAISQTVPSSDPRVIVTTSTGTQRTYDHVINTVPLAAIQAMDMSSLNLGPTRDAAIRMINYDAAMKVGIKFRSRWWEQQRNLNPPIVGGQSISDLPIRTCVYPSYGIPNIINTTNTTTTSSSSDSPAVLLASYTWGQDALRLASYLSSPDTSTSTANDSTSPPASITNLLNLTLTSLSTLHNIPLSFLQDQYMTHNAYAWYSSPGNAGGAFPLFAPGQFSGLMPLLMRPLGRKGRVHLAGDSLSAGHAWVVGGLNAGFRCVREILREMDEEDEEEEGKREGEGKGEGGKRVEMLERLWGPLIDIDIDVSAGNASSFNFKNMANSGVEWKKMARARGQVRRKNF